MTIGHKALRPRHRVLEADDQRKRLLIGNATTYSRWIRKEATSAIPSHAEKQPHGSRKSTLNCLQTLYSLSATKQYILRERATATLAFNSGENSLQPCLRDVLPGLLFIYFFTFFLARIHDILG